MNPQKPILLVPSIDQINAKLSRTIWTVAAPTVEAVQAQIDRAEWVSLADVLKAVR